MSPQAGPTVLHLSPVLLSDLEWSRSHEQEIGALRSRDPRAILEAAPTTVESPANEAGIGDHVWSRGEIALLAN